jgi:hypothetical protein
MRSRAISTIIICTYPFVTYTFTTSTTTSKKFPFIHKYYFDIITILNLWRSVLFIQSLSGWLLMKYFFWIYFWNDSFSFGETIRILSMPNYLSVCSSASSLICSMTLPLIETMLYGLFWSDIEMATLGSRHIFAFYPSFSSIYQNAVSVLINTNPCRSNLWRTIFH